MNVTNSQSTETWVEVIQNFKDNTGFDLDSSPEFDGIGDGDSLLSVLDDRHAIFDTPGEHKDKIIKTFKLTMKMMDKMLILVSGAEAKVDLKKIVYGAMGTLLLVRKHGFQELVSILGLFVRMCEALNHLYEFTPGEAEAKGGATLERILQMQVRAIGLAFNVVTSDRWTSQEAGRLLFVVDDPDIQNSLKEIYDFARTPDPLPFNRSIIRQALFQAGSSRFEKGASLDGLNLAIQIGEEALKDFSSLSEKERPSIMNNLGFMKTSRYNLKGMGRDLNEAVELCKEAVATVALTDKQRPNMLDNLGYCLSARYDSTANLSDLDHSIAVSREALELSKTNSNSPPHQYLANLSARLHKRFNRTSQPMDETESIDITYECVSTLEAGTLIHAVTLQNLGAMLSGKFKKTGFRRDLEEVIRILKLAYLGCPQGSEERGMVAYNLGESLMDRYKLTKELSDLRGAIRMSKEAVDLSDDGSHYRGRSLRSWVTQLNEHFLRTNTEEDLDTALDAVTEALASPHTRLSTRFFYLKHAERLLGTKFLQSPSFETFYNLMVNILSVILETPAEQRSEKFKNEEYRNQSVKKLLSQLGRIGTGILEGEKDRMGVIFLRTLHRELTDRHKTMDFVDAWAEAVHGCVDIRFDVYRNNFDAVKAETEEFLRQGASFGLNNARLRCRLLDYSVTLPKDKPTDEVDTTNHTALDHVIRQAEAKVARTSEDDALSRGYALANLAQHLRERFLQTKSLEDLEKAVTSAESATSLFNDANSSPQTRAPILFVLSMTLKTRYQRQGDIKDLERCITCAEKAIISVDDPNFKGMASMLNNFALIMRLSYQRTHALSDIDRALNAVAQAVELDQSMSGRMAALNNQGLVLEEKYERTRSLDDISEAIQSFRQALDIGSNKQSGSSGSRVLVPAERLRENVSTNLGNALASRHELTGLSEDLDEAILHGTIPTKRDRDSMFIIIMSNMLFLRYKRDGTHEDLENSIQYARNAISYTSADNPDQAYFLTQLGDALATKAEKYPSQETFLQCIEVQTRLWDFQIARPSDRIQAAWKAGRYLYRDKRYKEAADMIENAILLMPRLGPRWIGRGDQQNRLATFAGLPGDAALAALQAGRDASHALRLLEFGRGIMMGIELDNRSEISHVEGSEYPELFRRFNILRVEMEVADSKHSHRNAELYEGGRRREAMAEMERVLEEIRRLPGHKNFLLPPESDDLMKMALDGPIVIISTSSLTGTGAAIIVQTSRISSLPLEKLSHAEVTKRMDEMGRKILRGSLKTFIARNEKMRGLLLWLWETAVGPVLSELGYMSSNRDGPPLPHVRWMGVGPLSSAPFHAAGDGRPASKSATMDRAISSYLPTLRALAFAHERRPKKYLNRKRDASLLVVSMPETPDAGALPSVDGEVKSILATAASTSIRGTLLRTPTAVQVLEELPMNNIVHFACHGVSDAADPSNSHLLLADGWLTVTQILRNHAAEPDLAFLSACSTAHNRAAPLADESIHIVNSFQQVGFRHVVGSMWTAGDEACHDIARSFYGHLLGGREEEWDGTWKVAEALHFAIGGLREKECDLPLLWAPFVAFGG